MYFLFSKNSIKNTAERLPWLVVVSPESDVEVDAACPGVNKVERITTRRTVIKKGSPKNSKLIIIRYINTIEVLFVRFRSKCTVVT